MRTTIDIPEELLRRVKSAAALRGMRLTDVVRDALQRLLVDEGRVSDTDQITPTEDQTLGAGCVFPLLTRAAGPAMRDLRGASAQRLLDEEELSRATDPR
ncbi:MAG: hypothetical protein VX427_08780 [Acidobacteriota bacterium]|nr:hypothetical protein [Acidobacteriota bacterium]